MILCDATRPDSHGVRMETSRFRRFAVAEILNREKANWDIRWGEGEIEHREGESPKALMAEIVRDLKEAMTEFSIAGEDNEL